MAQGNSGRGQKLLEDPTGSGVAQVNVFVLELVEHKEKVLIKFTGRVHQWEKQLPCRGHNQDSKSPRWAEATRRKRIKINAKSCVQVHGIQHAEQARTFTGKGSVGFGWCELSVC